MSTLSNVITRRDETTPPSVGLTPDAFPEAVSSQTGVSVRYVPEPGKQWFVFHVSYGRVDKAADFILEDGTYVYIAKRYACKMVNGKQKKILEPLIPNLLFVYTTKDKAEGYIKNTSPNFSYLSYYYNHFSKDKTGNNPPLTISSKDMENFILATCNMNQHLLFVQPSQCHYKGGELVRVIEGTFAGIEGRVARVAGQQRVVISLSNIGLISTAYIPTAFLRLIDTD
jgi:transcription antitermination factor NusG